MVLVVILVVPPSPKSQNRFVMKPVEVSVKVTVSGSPPLVGLAVKPADGGNAATVSVTPREMDTPVAVLLKLIVSVKVPAHSELAAELMEAVMLVLVPAPRVKFVADRVTVNQLEVLVMLQNM